MSKKLNTDQITRELEGSAFFPPKQEKVKEQAPKQADKPNDRTDSRADDRTLNRSEKRSGNSLPVGKEQRDTTVIAGKSLFDDLKAPKLVKADIRRTKRYSFEAFEDQIEAVEDLQTQYKKRTGKKFSASQLIREALDLYLSGVKGSQTQ